MTFGKTCTELPKPSILGPRSKYDIIFVVMTLPDLVLHCHSYLINFRSCSKFTTSITFVSVVAINFVLEKPD